VTDINRLVETLVKANIPDHDACRMIGQALAYGKGIVREMPRYNGTSVEVRNALGEAVMVGYRGIKGNEIQVAESGQRLTVVSKDVA
jgi:hypothetical protein